MNETRREYFRAAVSSDNVIEGRRGNQSTVIIGRRDLIGLERPRLQEVADPDFFVDPLILDWIFNSRQEIRYNRFLHWAQVGIDNQTHLVEESLEQETKIRNKTNFQRKKTKG